MINFIFIIGYIVFIFLLSRILRKFFPNNKELLRRLHIVENNNVIQGAEAFLHVWKKIPKYKFLYSFFKLPIIFFIFKYVYEIVAFFLYLKNKKQLKI